MERQIDRDLTVILRSGKRHVFQYCRDLNHTWHTLVGTLVNLLTVSASVWKLLIPVVDGYMLVAPDDNVPVSLRHCSQHISRLGRIEVFLVHPDAEGIFPDAPDCDSDMAFVPSDAPVQLPKGLVDFIDHLRPASQVS
jgi:hypothetical protein